MTRSQAEIRGKKLKADGSPVMALTCPGKRIHAGFNSPEVRRVFKHWHRLMGGENKKILYLSF